MGGHCVRAYQPPREGNMFDNAFDFSRGGVPPELESAVVRLCEQVYCIVKAGNEQVRALQKKSNKLFDEFRVMDVGKTVEDHQLKDEFVDINREMEDAFTSSREFQVESVVRIEDALET